MVESLNSKADIVEKAVYHHGTGTYGQIMVGNKAFEFYGDNVNYYLQIPWDEVNKIINFKYFILFSYFSNFISRYRLFI